MQIFLSRNSLEKPSKEYYCDIPIIKILSVITEDQLFIKKQKEDPACSQLWPMILSTEECVSANRKLQRQAEQYQ